MDFRFLCYSLKQIRVPLVSHASAGASSEQQALVEARLLRIAGCTPIKSAKTGKKAKASKKSKKSKKGKKSRRSKRTKKSK